MLSRGLGVRTAVSAAGFLAVLVGLVTPWWNVESELNGSPLEAAHVKPFDDDGADLQGEVVVTGILALLSMLALGAAGGLQFAPVPAWTRPLLAGTSAVLGAVAVFHATFAWPSDDLGFFDEQTGNYGFPIPVPGNDGPAFVDLEVTLRSSAGFGWYLSIAGGIVAPLGVAGLEWLHGARQPLVPGGESAPGAPPASVPPLRGPAPRVAEVAPPLKKSIRVVGRSGPRKPP